MLEYSGFGGRLVRRSVLTTCISLLIASAVLCALNSGCGGNLAAESYLTEAGQMIFEVNTKAGELKKYWTLPLADQGNLSKTLAGFRKLLGTTQNKLDSAHPPEQCLGLDEKLRQVVDKARELTELYSPFADYFDGTAPLVNQMAEAVSSLEALQKEKDVPSGLMELADKARTIDVKARSITPPLVFTGMHQEFEHFIESIVASFERASNEYGASSQRNDYSNAESYQQAQTDETGTAPTDGQSSSQKSNALPTLQSVPEDWTSFNAQLSNIINSVLDVTGVKVKNAEFETLVGQAAAEIQRLEKQFK